MKRQKHIITTVVQISGLLCIILFHLFFIFWIEIFHYVGYKLPYLFIFFLPTLLMGRLSRTSFKKSVFTVFITLIIAVFIYSIHIAVHSGLSRLAGWYQDLFYHLILYTVFVIFSFSIGLFSRDLKRLKGIALLTCILLIISATMYKFYTVVQNFAGGTSLGVDVKNKSYQEAIETLCDRLEYNYPYFEYKNINFQKTRNEAYLNLESVKTGDDFSRIVRGIVNDLQDGHMAVIDPKMKKNPKSLVYWGAWFVKIDNRWIVSEVFPESTADSIGMKPGMELLIWNNEPISEAVKSVPDDLMNVKLNTPWGDRFAEQKRLRYLLVQPVGTKMSVTYLDWNENRLTKEFKFKKVNFYRFIPSISFRKLADNIGYIKIKKFNIDPLFFVSSLDKAIESLWDTEGLIIDIRDNGGGAVILTDQILGRFTESKIRYGGIKNFKGGFVPLTVVPRRPIYKKDVVLLMNEKCKSAAEYFAFAASKIGRITLFGRPTYGMVSSPSYQYIHMPEGLKLEFYTAGLTDKSCKFVVEWFGVKPDHHIPYSIDCIRQDKDLDMLTAIDFLKKDSN